jgi:hypothetical protein
MAGLLKTCNRIRNLDRAYRIDRINRINTLPSLKEVMGNLTVEGVEKKTGCERMQTGILIIHPHLTSPMRERDY